MIVTFTNPINDPFIVMPHHQNASYQSAGGLTNNGPISGVANGQGSAMSVGFTYNSSGAVTQLTLTGLTLNISTNGSHHSVYGLLVF